MFLLQPNLQIRNDDIDDNDKQDIVFYEKLDTTNTSRFIVKSVLMADSEMMLFTNDKVFINNTEVTDDSKIIGSLSNAPNNKRLHILSNKDIEDKEKSFIHFITGIDMKKKTYILRLRFKIFVTYYLVKLFATENMRILFTAKKSIKFTAKKSMKIVFYMQKNMIHINS